MPVGSDALDELRWTGGAWTPVSPLTTQYAAWTRAGTYESLETLFNAVAGEPGGLGASGDGLLFNLNRESLVSNRVQIGLTINATLDAIWPSGETPPFIWLVSPSFHGWLPNYTVAAFTRPGDSAIAAQGETADFVIEPYIVAIDGVPYDVGVVQCPLTRPNDTDLMIARMVYTPPLATARVVEQTTENGGGGGGGGGGGNGGGGGFPSTRTQVFQGQASGTSSTTNAVEDWIPNQLYELKIGSRTRHLMLSTESGSFEVVYNAPDIAGDNTLESVYLYMTMALGGRSTLVHLQLEAAGAGVQITVNKIT